MNAHTMTKSVLAALAGIAVAFTGGCQASKWEANLSAGPETAEMRQPETFVRFREVPWERVDGTLASMQSIVAGSATHPDEWTAAQKLDHKAKLLGGLQISEPVDTVRILGKSEFRTTDKIVAPSDEMKRIANELGADTVVWSAKLLGKADRVVQEPITVFNDGTYWRDGRSRTETQTGWVPVRVQVDETAYIAFFLRCK